MDSFVPASQNDICVPANSLDSISNSELIYQQGDILTEIFDAPNPRKKSTERRQVLVDETENKVVQVKSA
jgi:hypothetical protein